MSWIAFLGNKSDVTNEMHLPSGSFDLARTSSKPLFGKFVIASRTTCAPSVYGRTQFTIGDAPGLSPRSRDESNRSGVGKNFKSNTIGNHGDRLFFSIDVRIPPI